MGRVGKFVLAALCMACLAAVAADEAVRIHVAEDASTLERFAAAEVRRYVYLRTGQLLPIIPGEDVAGDAIVIGMTSHMPAVEQSDADQTESTDKSLEDQEYRLITVKNGPNKLLLIVGNRDTATLCAAYRFAEHLGVRFYLDGDIVPDKRVALKIPDLDECRRPLFALRGVLPFHDFPEGPDWWNLDDYRAILGQLPKLGMNFIGLHAYPEDRPSAEPTVWIGLPEDVAEDGKVVSSYSAAYYNTVMPVNWGLAPRNTGEYHFGAAALFDRDDYGSEVMRGLTPRPQSEADCNEIFDRTGALFHDAFEFARLLGVKTCLGTETPLVVPRRVAKRINPGLDAFEAVGGEPFEGTGAVEGTEDDPVYRSMREGVEAYHILVPEGFYDVSLHFCETTHTTERERVFDVKIEGITAIQSLDIFAKVGKNKAFTREFRQVYVMDERLDIQFASQAGKPCIAAISVFGKDVSLRIDCGGRGYKGFVPDAGMHQIDRATREKLYEGIFTRIAKTHPLDYFWLWTPETWTWKGADESQVNETVDDIMAAATAAERLDAPFGLATCGWVLGPPSDRSLFDKVLPGEMALSCINRAVGMDPVEPGFADIEQRPKWAIPWLEDDPAMVSPQLWAGRMRKDAADALKYGCTGLMGIHWRTRIIGPNVSALASAAWEQGEWAEIPAGQAPEPRNLPVTDFYADWAQHSFGQSGAGEIAEVFARLDGNLPRPSDWVDGPGGFKPADKPWSEVAGQYGFVDELEALRPKVEGKGNLSRFDYWLDTFRYMRESDRMRCLWKEATDALDRAKAEQDPNKRTQIALESALPARQRLVECVASMFTHLLATVSTPGEMGTIANLEQHTLPDVLHSPGKELAEILGEELPASAVPSADYLGAPRAFVPTVRSSYRKGEKVTVTAVVLSRRAPEAALLFWRPLGTGDFDSVPLENVTRGVYKAVLLDETLVDDIEYYLEIKLGEEETLHWPATAPELNQTMVAIPTGTG